VEGEDRLAQSVPARLSPAYSASAGRKFGLTVGIAFLVLGAIARWRGHPATFIVLESLGATLVLAGLLIPRKLGIIERAWMKLAHLISRVTTPIFMGIVYFVVLTPVGFIRRSLGGNALIHRPGQTGLWLDRSGSARSALDRLF